MLFIFVLLNGSALISDADLHIFIDFASGKAAQCEFPWECMLSPIAFHSEAAFCGVNFGNEHHFFMLPLCDVSPDGNVPNVKPVLLLIATNFKHAEWLMPHGNYQSAPVLQIDKRLYILGRK